MRNAVLVLMGLLVSCATDDGRKKKKNSEETDPTTDTRNDNGPRDVEALLRQHVDTLAIDFVPRDYGNPQNLDLAADYIKAQLETAVADVSFQEFEVQGEIFKNVVASMGPLDGPRIVVGAHYDAYSTFPGADDNASGVAGLIEIAHQIDPDIGVRVDLVAYTLEEPPFFRSANMGSAVHADSLADAGVNVEAMICLEMIGYYADSKGTQEYPADVLESVYGTVGDFVSVVGRQDDEDLIVPVRDAMGAAAELRVESLAAPPYLTGVDFSDHLNYWENDYPAVMITDTAFYRNDAYHTRTDTPETLHYDKMADVVAGVAAAVEALAAQ